MDLFGDDFSKYGTELLMRWGKVTIPNEIKKILHIVRLGQLADSTDSTRLSWTLPTSVSFLAVKFSLHFNLNSRGTDLYSADTRLTWHLT